MQFHAVAVIALALCCSATVHLPSRSDPTAEQMAGDAAAIEKVDQADEKQSEKDVAALNSAAKTDDGSADALEAQAASMFADARAMQQAADASLKDETTGAEGLRGNSTADAAAVERGADLERANRAMDSVHIRQIALHLEEQAQDKEKSAQEEQQDAAGVEGEWLQEHNRDAGDAKALRFLAEKTAEKTPAKRG